MNPREIITKLNLYEAKEDGAPPEACPLRLFGVFRNRFKARVFTDETKQTWLLFDKEWMVFEHKLS